MDMKILLKNTSENESHVNQASIKFISKLFYGTLLLLIIEVCVGFYIYLFMINQYNKIERTYLLKDDFQDYFLKSATSDEYKNQLREFLTEHTRSDALLGIRRKRLGKCLKLICSIYFYLKFMFFYLKFNFI